MCRSIHTLYNIEPPVTQDEVRAAALQFVRKISGYNKPSRTNELAYMTAVDAIEDIATRLLAALETTALARVRSKGVSTRG